MIPLYAMSSMDGDWVHLDETSQPQAFIEYLKKVSSSHQALSYKKELDSLLGIQPHFKILEVGCGLGDDAFRRATLLGEHGKYIAIDTSHQMVTAANTKLTEPHPNLEFQTTDGEHLSFENDSFDRVVSDRVFQHIANPAPLLAEISRVLKPGGQFLVCDTNWKTLTIKNTSHSAYHALKKQRLKSVPHPHVIEVLKPLLKEKNFSFESEDTFHVSNQDYKLAIISFRILDGLRKSIEENEISEEQAQQWLFELQKMARDDAFVSTVEIDYICTTLC